MRLTGERGHSVRDLDERVAAVHAAVAGRSDLVGDVVSAYDDETGDITVEVAPRVPAADGGPAPAALVAELRAALPPQA